MRNGEHDRLNLLRTLVWLCLLLASPSLAWGQGARVDNPGGPATRSVQGFLAPLPGATITVCTSAATGTPCSPLVPTSPVTLCTDSSCAVAAPNPFTADASGNFGFWAIPGTYKVSVTAPGTTGYLLTVTVPIANGSNISVGSISASGQITSTVTTGTPPLVIASTTVVPNLNAQLHNGLTAPASAIVGISDTQSLTNKTLTGASTGNSVSILNAQKDASPIVGTGGAVTVYTYTIPPNTIANLKGFRLTTSFSHTTGNGTVNYLISLNGQTLWSLSISSTNFGTVGLTVLNSGATTGDCALTTQWQNGGIVLSPTVSGLSWSSNQVLTITFSAANTEQVTPIMWIVEQIQ